MFDSDMMKIYEIQGHLKHEMMEISKKIDDISRKQDMTLSRVEGEKLDYFGPEPYSN